jgi:hypothetical protein
VTGKAEREDEDEDEDGRRKPRTRSDPPEPRPHLDAALLVHDPGVACRIAARGAELRSTKPMLVLPRPVLRCVIAAAITLAAATSFAQSPPARVARPSVEIVGGDRARVRVRLDREVEVTGKAEPGRVTYRLHGARIEGLGKPQHTVVDDGPISGTSIEQSGDDVEIDIDVRRPVGAGHRVVASGSGAELVIDITDSRPARAAPPPRAPPPETSPPKPAPTPARPAPPSTAASPPSPPENGGDPRVLLGHRFIAPSRFDSAIVTTSLGVALDFGLVSLDERDAVLKQLYPAYVAGLVQTVDLSLRVHPRLALIAAVAGSVETGASAQSAVNLGAEGAVMWRVGAEGVIARLERVGTQVAARLVVEGRAGGRIESIEQLFEGTLRSRSLPLPSAFFDARSSTTARFSWSAAQALGRHFSVQSAFGWVATRSALTAPIVEDEVDMTVGLALTADVYPLVPLAIQLEYAGDVVLSESVQRGGGPAEGPAYLLGDSDTHAFVAGLYYTGKPDLQLGALAGTALYVDDPARSSVLARFELRAHF